MDQWQLADRNNCTTMPLNHGYQPRTNTLYGFQNSLLGEATMRQFFESQWLTSQVIMTLASEQPQPTLASHSKQWHPLGWQTKFMAHQVIHDNDHPTHTPHPTPGIAYVLLYQEGQVPHLLPLLLPIAHSYPPKQFYFCHLPSCFWA